MVETSSLRSLALGLRMWLCIELLCKVLHHLHCENKTKIPPTPCLYGDCGRAIDILKKDEELKAVKDFSIQLKESQEHEGTSTLVSERKALQEKGEGQRLWSGSLVSMLEEQEEPGMAEDFGVEQGAVT